MPTRLVLSLGILMFTGVALSAVAQSSNDTVLEAPAGVERLRIDQNTGHVGIGTAGSQPANRLHVKENADLNTILRLENTNAGTAAASLLCADTGAATGNLIAHGSGRTLSRFGQVLGGWTELLQTNGNGLIIGTQSTKPLILGTNSGERMRITETGKVGINNSAPGARLTVSEYADGGIAMRLGLGTTVEQNPAQPQVDWGLIVNAQQNVYSGVQNTGSLTGIHAEALNTGSGLVGLTIGTRAQSGVYASGSVNQAYGFLAQVLSGQGTVTTGYGVYVSDTQAINDFGFYQVAANDSNYFAGNTGIGGQPTGNKLEVYGNANFNGTVTGTEIRATYQDIAEWVPSRLDLSPGTVVVLDPTIGNAVLASTTAYDTTVAGVVSAQPGLLLGVPGAEKEQIATTGRVRVRVDATRAPIRVGDLLVTGERPGMAMRSEPVEINGRAFHQPGTILGKALEPLTGGEGEILVLLSLQ